MVFEATVDAVVRLVLAVGVPLLFVLFYFEGLIVGKLLQPPVAFVTVVAITRPPPAVLVVLVTGCSLAVTAGQWTIFRQFEVATRDDAEHPDPGVLVRLSSRAVDRIGERRRAMVDRLFERFGALGIAISMYVPGVRGLLAIPAGMSSYPVGRFVAATFLGSVLYFVVLVAVAFGIVELAELGLPPGGVQSLDGDHGVRSGPLA